MKKFPRSNKMNKNKSKKDCLKYLTRKMIQISNFLKNKQNSNNKLNKNLI